MSKRSTLIEIQVLAIRKGVANPCQVLALVTLLKVGRVKVERVPPKERWNIKVMVKVTVIIQAPELVTFLMHGAQQDVTCALGVMTLVRALAHMTGHVIDHVKITNIGLKDAHTNICRVAFQVTPQSLNQGQLGDVGNSIPNAMRHLSTTQVNLNLGFTLVTHQAMLTRCPITDIMLVSMGIQSGCLKTFALMEREAG